MQHSRLVRVVVALLILAGAGIVAGAAARQAATAPADEGRGQTKPAALAAGKLKAALAAIEIARQAIEAGDSKAALDALDQAKVLVTVARQALAPRFVNVVCPMKGKRIDPANVPENLIREYKGQLVAFCCDGCPQAWDSLSDSEKDAKLAAAMAPPPAKVVNGVCPIMGTRIDPAKVPDSLTRLYKGQKVGFCCAACPPAWDSLSDSEKDAKLAAAMAKQ